MIDSEDYPDSVTININFDGNSGPFQQFNGDVALTKNSVPPGTPGVQWIAFLHNEDSTVNLVVALTCLMNGEWIDGQWFFFMTGDDNQGNGCTVQIFTETNCWPLCGTWTQAGIVNGDGNITVSISEC
jgi:hypothetical protein